MNIYPCRHVCNTSQLLSRVWLSCPTSRLYPTYLCTGTGSTPAQIVYIVIGLRHSSDADYESVAKSNLPDIYNMAPISYLLGVRHDKATSRIGAQAHDRMSWILRGTGLCSIVA